MERLAPGRHHALSGEPPRCSSDNGLVPDQSGAHGVELHVPRRGQEVVFIHDERGEAALSQVPSPPFPEGEFAHQTLEQLWGDCSPQR